MKKKSTIYYGLIPLLRMVEEYSGCDMKPVKFSRVWAMPNAWTFQIKPIAALLKSYMPHPHLTNRWIDPYAGTSNLATFSNDHNPVIAKVNGHRYNMEALAFAKKLKGKYDGILFDPPYSFRQISEHYKLIGKKATQIDTSMAFYERTKSAFCEKIRPGGYAISFGWNTNGFGKARGFEIVEIMAVAHGGSKNDTIVVVEKKL